MKTLWHKIRLSLIEEHLLLSKDDQLVQTFTDPLSSIQEQILDLLSISPSVYA